MNNNKQSSIEWLIKELKDLGYYTYNLEKLCEQAKAMHKEEIEDAYNEALYDHRQEDGKQYYNKKFGGNG